MQEPTAGSVKSAPGGTLVAAHRRAGAQPKRDASAEAPPAPVRETRLNLNLTNDSWVEVYDARGERLFYDVASAGSVHSVSGRGPLRVVLGNAAGVSVEVDGRAREIPASALDGEGAVSSSIAGARSRGPANYFRRTMSRNIQPVTGMKDVLAADIGLWQHVEASARAVMDAYGYDEIRVPVVEHTELFKRAIGEYTDVVEKEMYTFTDQGGDSLTLRPEATAGVVRAAISNGLLRGARLKLWCQGPMFRHEKPQKGRFRQFNQVDLEAIGFAGPDVDIEIIALTRACGSC
jgi:hypothetical protein